MADMLTQSEFDQLKQAVSWSIDQLEKPRSQRLEAVKQLVGSHYAEGGTDRRVPTNFIELAVTTYARQLAARSPRALVTTDKKQLKVFAREFELALNQIPEEINLGRTLRLSVVHALFSCGIVKLGLHQVGTVMGIEYGQPFVDVVGFDDYFVDMSARDYTQIQYEGNDYWMSYDDAKELFGSALTDLPADDHTVTGNEGHEKAEGISGREGADLYQKKIELRDVWIPDSGKVVTYALRTGRQLRAVTWDGPIGGPYRRLSFTDVPDNILPLPPVALWRDLHELANSLMRKLARQAQAQKTVLGFQGGNDDSIREFQSARDGDGIRFSGGKPEQLVAGGIDQTTLAFYLQVRDLFSYFGGNLDAIGGLAPMTETVGQDKLLTEAASARIKDMADAVRRFSRGIFQALAWYEWTDPVRKRTLEKELPGTGIAVTVNWTPETRAGDFLDFNFDIDVFSMQDDSPGARLQRLTMTFREWVLPLLPYIQQQGGQVDFNALLDLVARYANVPDLKDVVQFAQSQGMEGGVQGNSTPSTMPAHTTRTYERVNRPGATRQGKDQVLTQLLLGNAQKSEAATLFRGVS
jgi:hypothetical protein